MKTAVQYLVREFSDILGVTYTTKMQDLLIVDAIEKAVELEKNQIISAFQSNDGFENGEDYFSATYNENI